MIAFDVVLTSDGGDGFIGSALIPIADNELLLECPRLTSMNSTFSAAVTAAGANMTLLSGSSRLELASGAAVSRAGDSLGDCSGRLPSSSATSSPSSSFYIQFPIIGYFKHCGSMIIITTNKCDNK